MQEERKTSRPRTWGVALGERSRGRVWYLCNGIPDAVVKRKKIGFAEHERIVEEFGEPERKMKGRYSGRKYENDQSKLDAIREKYRNGVSREMIEEWIMGL